MAQTAHPNRRLTYDDFLLFPDDGLRHEIIGGVHYVTPAPSLRHQDLVGRLYLALANFLTAHPGIGRALLSPLDVIFTIHDIVEPDLLFVASDQLHVMTEQNIQGAPAIVVEVVSKSTRRRDERIKRELFERGGVREYWIVDPDRTRVTVYRRTGDSFADRLTLSTVDDGVLTTPFVPGFSLPLSELFKPSVQRPRPPLPWSAATLANRHDVGGVNESSTGTGNGGGYGDAGNAGVGPVNLRKRGARGRSVPEYPLGVGWRTRLFQRW